MILGTFPFGVLTIINTDFKQIIDQANLLAGVLNAQYITSNLSFTYPPEVSNWEETGYINLNKATLVLEETLNRLIIITNQNELFNVATGDKTPVIKLQQSTNLSQPLLLNTAACTAISNNLTIAQNCLNHILNLLSTYGYCKQSENTDDVKDFFLPLAASIKNQIKSSNFNVAFFTDPHWQRSELGYTNGPLSWNHIDNVGMFDDTCDVMISAGDNNNSYDPDLSILRRELIDYSNKFFNQGNHSDKYLLVGNHDDGSLRNELIDQPLTPDNIINEQSFKVAFRTRYKLNSETRNGDSLWFYKDYDDKAIRLIGLNSEDIDDTLTNSDGSIRYDRQHIFAIRQAQFDFLINALLTAPVGYQVLIVAHVQADPTTVHYSDADEIHHNYQILINLIDAFVLGDSVDEAGTDTDFEVTVKADFSGRGKGILIGYWNGHTHTQKFLKTGQAQWMDVHCPNSVADQSWHVVGQPSEDAFDILSVDTQKRHVTIYGFGAASDREYDY